MVLTPHTTAGTRDLLAAKMRALFVNENRFFKRLSLENAVNIWGSVGSGLGGFRLPPAQAGAGEGVDGIDR